MDDVLTTIGLQLVDTNDYVIKELCNKTFFLLQENLTFFYKNLGFLFAGIS